MDCHHRFASAAAKWAGPLSTLTTNAARRISQMSCGGWSVRANQTFCRARQPDLRSPADQHHLSRSYPPTKRFDLRCTVRDLPFPAQTGAAERSRASSDPPRPERSPREGESATLRSRRRQPPVPRRPFRVSSQIAFHRVGTPAGTGATADRKTSVLPRVHLPTRIKSGSAQPPDDRRAQQPLEVQSQVGFRRR